MTVLIIVLLVLAVLSAGGGIFVSAAKFLLWIALGLAALAVIVWAARAIAGRARRGIRR